MGAWKWIIGGLGWAVGGPIGALIGIAIGSFAEGHNSSNTNQDTKSSSSNGSGPHKFRSTQNDISVSLLVLTAAIMKADGKVLKSELNYVKRYLTDTFGTVKAQELLTLLRDLLQKNIDIVAVCNQIRMNTTFSTRVNILDYLFGIAYADGHCSVEENQMLNRIARLLHISDTYVYSIRSRHAGTRSGSYSYSGSTSTGKDPYAVLGIDKNATDDDVKKAYRRLAMKYHPDRVETMGEEIKRNAEKQFKEINEAYEKIKKDRNMA